MWKSGDKKGEIVGNCGEIGFYLADGIPLPNERIDRGVQLQAGRER